MKIKESTIVNISIFAILVLFIGYAMTYSPRARLVPLTFAVPALFLSIWVVIKDLMGKRVREEKFDLFKVNEVKRAVAPTAQPKERPKELDAGKREITIFLLTISFFALVFLLGFLPGIFVFMLIFLKFFGDMGWFPSSALAVAMVVVIYATFGLVLDIPFAWGYLVTIFMEG